MREEGEGGGEGGGGERRGDLRKELYICTMDLGLGTPT